MAVEHFLPSAIAHFEPADLIGALTTGIVMLDSDLCVVYANVAAQDLLAASVNQARGKPFLSLVLEADSLGVLMRRAVETGETLSERELSVQAGPLGREHRVIDVTMTPLDSEFDRKYLLLEIADATQRQRITRENELISRLDSSRQMVRQLAHEIKNPLGGLRGAAQLLERELHEHLREYTGVIISEADRLTALVDSMIGPARAPQKALINVHELCEHVYRLLRSEARGGVLVERDYDPSLPNAEVDANQIIQALLNVGRNALLAIGERGRIVIRTRIAANVNIGTTRHKLAASLQVEDNGPGVPPDIADTIFFPLVTGRANGTGLGLAVSQDLVTRHGGLIEFESKPGRTVFTILLPLPENA
ncbi:MAG TPA: nitrogen regulation protein NR(II) [Steroidobacteraceae bacterium]|nr:nitrogen regulation protein NR(II) [Steroidobacteraceae bacterium]